MPLDLDGLADLVVLTVKNAIAPLQQKLALVEQENANLRVQLSGVTELRDRIVAVETKTAERQPLIDTTVLRPESRTYPVEIHPFDPSPLLAQIEALKQDVTPMRERLAVVETKTSAEVLTKAEVDLLIADRVAAAVEPVTAVRERVAALEARAPIPGPAGKDGADGRDGQNGNDGAPGRDGADGLGFDDMDIEQDGRTLVLKFERGTQKKTWPIQLPFLQYEGVYIEGKSYDRGSVVTWAGSTWHANEQTSSKPGESSRAWTLVVKKGRDGRDGRDGSGGVPVVAVGR